MMHREGSKFILIFLKKGHSSYRNLKKWQSHRILLLFTMHLSKTLFRKKDIFCSVEDRKSTTLQRHEFPVCHRFKNISW